FDERFTLELLFSATDIEIFRRSRAGEGNVEIDGTEFVVEPRLRFALFGERLTGFVSTHHFRHDQDEFIDLFGGGSFDDETRTDAIFGEATWALTPSLDLTLGGRLESE